MDAPFRSRRRAGARRVRWVALAPLLLTAACLREPRREPLPPPPPVPTGIYYEEALPAPRFTKIEIIDISETPSADGARITVAGTLINRGTTATTEVSITVTALDRDDRPVLRLSAVPETNRIAADGGTTRFAAVLDNRPEVTRYHVEAVAR